MNQQNIKLLVLDVDGTLTDGKIHMGEHGELFKSFHAKDGYGIVNKLPTLGIFPVIITGRKSEIVMLRGKELGIKEIHQGISDKETMLEMILQKYQLNWSQVAYMGDDLNDLPAMRKVGLKACPCDGAKEVKEIADFVSEAKGGQGAVREFIDFLSQKY